MFSTNMMQVAKHLLGAKKCNLDHNEQRQAEKIMKALVKKFKKAKILDEFEKAINEETSHTKCVTVERYRKLHDHMALQIVFQS